MNRLGKVLVLGNTAMSLAFLVWAIAVNTESIPWFSTKVGNEQVVGKVDEIHNRLKDLSSAYQRADTRWSNNYQQLVQAESQIPLRRDFYRDKIQIVIDGRDLQKQQRPITELEADPTTGLLKLDTRQGRPINFRGLPLASITNYNNNIRSTITQINEEQGKIEKLLVSQEDLNKVIFGIPGVQKGLRTFIQEQKDVIASAKSGSEYLQTFINNRQVETSIFTKRERSLLNRMQELESLKVSRQLP